MKSSLSIAVVIPVYNCAAYIDEALASLEAQTRPPDWVVVVDDGSTDGSADIVADFSAHSGLPIQLLRRAHAGIAATRNVGVACCREDLIAFLDSDDTFCPTFLERTARVLENHPELTLCFTDRDVVDEAGKFMRRDLDDPSFRAMPTKRLADGTSILTESPFVTLASHTVIPFSILARRSAFEQVGGFDDGQHIVDDKPFLMRLAKVGKLGFIDEPLGVWRRHGSATTTRKNAFKNAWYDDRALAKLEEEAARWSLSPNELEAIREARMHLAPALLYAASYEARFQFFQVAFRMVKEKQIGWSPVLRGTLRYGWYRAAGRRPT